MPSSDFTPDGAPGTASASNVGDPFADLTSSNATLVASATQIVETNFAERFGDHNLGQIFQATFSGCRNELRTLNAGFSLPCAGRSLAKRLPLPSETAEVRVQVLFQQRKVSGVVLERAINTIALVSAKIEVSRDHRRDLNAGINRLMELGLGNDEPVEHAAVALTDPAALGSFLRLTNLGREVKHQLANLTA